MVCGKVCFSVRTAIKSFYEAAAEASEVVNKVRAKGVASLHKLAIVLDTP